MQVKGKRMDVDSGIRTRSRAKHQAEQWSMEPAPAKILALLADYLQEQQSQALSGAASTYICCLPTGRARTSSTLLYRSFLQLA